MSKWIYLLLIAIVILLVELLIYFKQNREEDKLNGTTEKDKFYRTLRHFIYLITALILIPIIIKVLFVIGIVSK